MNVDKLLDNTQDQIQDLHSDAFTLVDNHMKTVARTWQILYPTHSIKFMDAMGTHGWLINGEWIEPPKYLHGQMVWLRHQDSVHTPQGRVSYESVYSSGERAQHRIYAPLFEAQEWYVRQIDRFDIAIEFNYEARAK